MNIKYYQKIDLQYVPYINYGGNIKNAPESNFAVHFKW